MPARVYFVLQRYILHERAFMIDGPVIIVYLLSYLGVVGQKGNNKVSKCKVNKYLKENLRTTSRGL